MFLPCFEKLCFSCSFAHLKGKGVGPVRLMAVGSVDSENFLIKGKGAGAVLTCELLIGLCLNCIGLKGI